MDYRLGGKRVRERLLGVSSRKAAVSAADRLWENLCERERTGLPAMGTGSIRTLADLVERHRGRSGISDSTRSMDTTHVKPLLRILGGDTPIGALKGDAIEQYKRTRSAETVGRDMPPPAPRRPGQPGPKPWVARIPTKPKRPVSPRTVNIELAFLRAAIASAVDDGLLEYAPCRIKLLPERAKKPHHLTRDEVEQLASAAPTPLRRAILFLANTGLRKSELYRLQWADVAPDLSRVLVHTMKRGRSRMLRSDPMPLNDTARSVLQEIAAEQRGRKPSDLVFGIPPEKRPKGGKGLDHGVPTSADTNVTRKLKAIARDAGIANPERVSLHVLRHTFATIVHSSGASLKNTAALMRHRNVSLTANLYAHEEMEGMRSAVDGLNLGASGPTVGTRTGAPAAKTIASKGKRRVSKRV